MYPFVASICLVTLLCFLPCSDAARPAKMTGPLYAQFSCVSRFQIQYTDACPTVQWNLPEIVDTGLSGFDQLFISDRAPIAQGRMQPLTVIKYSKMSD